MVKISSDNSDIEKGIAFLCDTLEQNGSYIDAAVEIVDASGQTSVFAAADCDAEYVFKLQHDILVPYGDFDFDVEGQDIVIAHADRNDNKTHQDILEVMIALYNQSGKFKNHLNDSPLLHFDDFPDLVRCLLHGREGRDVNIIRKTIGQPDFHDELALLTFFKSRLLHCRLHNMESAHSAVLIPVAEFMNHHAAGAGFDNLYSKKVSYMATKAAMPIEKSRECFTNYGRFDALDSYLHYGFVDESAKYLRSVPVRIDLGDVGQISVRAFYATVPVEEIPEGLKDLAFYFPKVNYNSTHKIVELSHLYIPQEGGRFSLRRILEYVVQLLEPKMDAASCRDCIGEMENQILVSNESYYSKLKLLVDKSVKNTIISSEIMRLSDMQYKKIVNYKTLVNR